MPLRVPLVRAASFEEEGEVVEGRATSRHQEEVCRTEWSAIDRQMGGRRIVGIHAREKGPQIAQDARLNPCSEIGAGLNRWLHATFFDRGVLTTRRTPTPSLANMSISESVLNKSMRPRRRSLTRGCVTRRIF